MFVNGYESIGINKRYIDRDFVGAPRIIGYTKGILWVVLPIDLLVVGKLACIELVFRPSYVLALTNWRFLYYQVWVKKL